VDASAQAALGELSRVISPPWLRATSRAIVSRGRRLRSMGSAKDQVEQMRETRDPGPRAGSGSVVIDQDVDTIGDRYAGQPDMAAMAARIADQVHKASSQRVRPHRHHAFGRNGKQQRRSLAPSGSGDILEQQRDVGFERCLGPSPRAKSR